MIVDTKPGQVFIPETGRHPIKEMENLRPCAMQKKEVKTWTR